MHTTLTPVTNYVLLLKFIAAKCPNTTYMFRTVGQVIHLGNWLAGWPTGRTIGQTVGRLANRPTLSIGWPICQLATLLPNRPAGMSMKYLGVSAGYQMTPNNSNNDPTNSLVTGDRYISKPDQLQSFPKCWKVRLMLDRGASVSQCFQSSRAASRPKTGTCIATLKFCLMRAILSSGLAYKFLGIKHWRDWNFVQYWPLEGHFVS
ncbi:hypothetical protein EDC01DRAFT_665578 [Geopyxis carbonaria]|nr:hypothetical protein EDC01DRAFT_665578 [Geopyxis carbonaria]